MQSELAHDRRWWILGVLSLCLLIISLDNTILNVALPSIEGDLGASASQMQWIVDSYVLVFAGLLLTAGSLGDRFGRKRALLLGLGVFGAGSLLSALSESADALIASRALMGVGGAFIMPTTLSVLTNVFPAKERPKAIGIWAAVAGIGVAIGPITGGALLEQFEWASVFMVNLPVVVVGIAGALWLIPESKDPEHSALDPVGAVLSIAGLSALVWGIIEAGGGHWGDPMVLAALGGGAALLALFARWELHTPSPMLDVRLFRIGAFSGASGSIALVFFALFGSIFFLTQYLQGVMDYTALEAGVRTLPVAAGLVVGGPLSAKLAERLGNRAVVSAGLAISAAGLALLAMVDVDSGYGLVAASMAVLGIGMGSSMAPATESIMSVLPEAHAGVGRGDERHHPDGGRLARRGGPRKPPVQWVRCRHGGFHRGAAGRGGRRRSEQPRRRIRRGRAARRRRRVGAEPRGGRRFRRRHGGRADGGRGCRPGGRAAGAQADARPQRGAEPARRRGAGARMTPSQAEKRAQDRAGAEEAPARGPGRPRSEKADEAILGSTILLLGEHGVRGLSIEAVAAAAGVGKTTIYRRWATKEDLVLAALARLRPPGPPPDTGSLAGDLKAFRDGQAKRLAGTNIVQVVPRVLAEAMGDPAFHRRVMESLVIPIRGLLAEMVERAVARGDLAADADVEMAVDLIHSALVYSLLTTAGSLAASRDIPARYASLVETAFAP